MAVDPKHARVLTAWRKQYGLPYSYACVDTETSGLDRNLDRVLNLGWCLGTTSRPDTARERFLVIDWTRVLGLPEMMDLRSRIGFTKLQMEKRGNTYPWTVENLKTGVHPGEAADTFLRECAGLPLLAFYGWKFDFPMIGKFLHDHGPGMDIDVLDLIDPGLMVKAVLGDAPPFHGEPYRDYLNRLDDLRVGLHSMKKCVDDYGLDRYGAQRSRQHDAGYDAWLVHLLYRELLTLAFGDVDPSASGS